MPQQYFFNTSWAACPMLHFQWRNFSLIVNLNLPWWGRGHLLLSCPLFPESRSWSTSGCSLPVKELWRETKSPLTLFYSPQLPQPLLVLQTLPQLCSLSWTHSRFSRWGPKLNPGFEAQPHQCSAQGKNRLPLWTSFGFSAASPAGAGRMLHCFPLLKHTTGPPTVLLSLT